MRGSRPDLLRDHNIAVLWRTISAYNPTVDIIPASYFCTPRRGRGQSWPYKAQETSCRKLKNLEVASTNTHTLSLIFLQVFKQNNQVDSSKMSPSSSIRRPVRIGGASGGFSDRVFAITRLAQNPEIDVIMGDWLSEMTMTIHGAGKINNQKKAKEGKSVRDGITGTGHHAAWNVDKSVKDAMFAENFIDCFKPAIPYLAKNGTKLAVNAGASDTEILAKYVKKLCEDAGHPMKVAYVSLRLPFDHV